MKEYWFIQCSEGGWEFTNLTKEELRARLAESSQPMSFLKRPPEFDGFCWTEKDGTVLIIKGTAIVPKPVAVITDYEI